MADVIVLLLQRLLQRHGSLVADVIVLLLQSLLQCHLHHVTDVVVVIAEASSASWKPCG